MKTEHSEFEANTCFLPWKHKVRDERSTPTLSKGATFVGFTEEYTGPANAPDVYSS